MPARSELVLEGDMYGDKTKLEGPFGEFMGYYASNASEQPIIKIRRVYYRHDPIITLAIPSRPPSNFKVARGVVKAAMIWDEVEKAGLAGVQGVWNHEAGAGRLFNVISIKQMYPVHASRRRCSRPIASRALSRGRWVVVVDEDIGSSDIHGGSGRCARAAIRRTISITSTATGARRSIRCCVLRLYENNRAIVNACKPWGWKGRSFPKPRKQS
jgi:4-hydroxy-3-polyprenylbenzoate decarboxylase